MKNHFTGSTKVTGPLLFFFLFFLTIPTEATKATINRSHDSTTIDTLDNILTRIRNGTSIDTIEFTGTGVDSFTWSISYTDGAPMSSLVIRYTGTNPDSFPIIRKSGNQSWNFFKNLDFLMENCILSSGTTAGDKNIVWTNFSSSGTTMQFRNCVIRGHNSNYFSGLFADNAGASIYFINCLFVNNAYVFRIYHYSAGLPKASFNVINCTFDNNGTILSAADISVTADALSDYNFYNCIFTSNGTFFGSGFPSGTDFRKQTKYSLIDASTSSYDPTCDQLTTSPYIVSSRIVPSDWQINPDSLAYNFGSSNVTLGTPGYDISDYTRIGNPDAGCWESQIFDFTWDVSSLSGFDAGSGTWSTDTDDDNWSYDGSTMTPWRGAGNSATFAGSDGTYNVTVDAIQFVDSVCFLNDGYTLTPSSATLSFPTKSGIYVAEDVTATISTKIAGTPGLSRYGSGTLVLTADNTFSGPVALNAGTLAVTTIDNGATASTLGSSDNTAANLVLDGGTLSYTGSTAGSTDRLITISAAAAAISADGSSAGATLSFINTDPLVFSGGTTHTFTLTGSHTGANSFTPVIGDDGANATSLVKSGNGTWHLGGTHTYTGNTTVSSGVLFINGSVTSDVTVASGATLGGTGTISGNCTVNGTIAAGADGFGTLTATRDLSFGATGTCAVAIDSTIADTYYDQIDVQGDFDAGDASLSVSLTYSPEIGDEFTFITVGGSVTGDFSNAEDGDSIIVSNGTECYYLKLSQSGGDGNDITLIVTSIVKDYTWDTETTSDFQPGNGGDWDGTSSNWSADGQLLAAWPDATGYTATFSGTDGTYPITISGTRIVDSLTFLSETYTVAGGTIDLGSNSGIHVASDKTGIIASIIEGDAGINKTGTGTLILSATNTVTTGLTIASGTLQLGDGGTEGSIPGTILNNGTLVYNRSNSTAFDEVISGSGSFEKIGEETVFFTADHTYSGGTTIHEGTLSIGDGDTDGSITGSIVNNASLLVNLTEDITLDSISGSGSLTKKASGSLILAADNTYTDSTLILGGTLQIGTGGTRGSIASASNIRNNGTLTINRSDGYTYSGIITGTGIFNHSGTDTVTLTGSNSFSGATTIGTDATLQIGDGTTSGTLKSTTIENSGVLIFNQDERDTLTGSISGTGLFVKKGSGILTMTGAATHTGGTMILAGGVTLGDGSTHGRLSGSVVNNGLLTFTTADTMTFTGVISGSGSVTKKGADTLTLLRSHSYTGATSVAEGVLLLDSNLASSGTVAIASGARLAGGGSCGQITIQNGGILVPATDTFTTARLLCGDSAHIQCMLGTVPGFITVSDSLHLDGVFDFTAGAGFEAGVYPILSYPAGKCTVGAPAIGTGPTGMDYAIDTSFGEVMVRVTVALVTVEPDSATAVLGASASFTVEAEGEGMLRYAWFHDDSAMDSDTLATLSIDAVDTADSGRYKCVVTDVFGNTDTTREVPLTIIYPPLIDSLLSATVSVFVGDTLRYGVTSSGTEPLTYTWYFITDGGDSLIDSSTSSVYLSDSAAFGDSGNYYCVVSNEGGDDTSDTLHVTIQHIPPEITRQPVHDTATVLAPASFSVAASGNESPSLAWYKTGSDTVYSTDTLFSIAKVTFSDSGNYFCVASNPGGSDTSDTVSLVVNHIAPEFTVPADTSADSLVTALIYTDVVILAHASGNASPVLSWYMQGKTDPVTYGDTLMLDSILFSHSGYYYCVAENPAGSDTSRVFHISVLHYPPVPGFSYSNITGTAPLTVSFSDTSSGTISSRLWDFGDDSTSKEKNPSHVYTEPGLYTVTLTITGPGGSVADIKSDLVFVYEEGGNPVRLTARYLQDSDVRITLTNLNSIVNASSDPEYDSLGIWYKAQTLPSAPSDGVLLTRRTLADLTDDTLAFTATLPESDTLYGLMCGLFKNSGSVTSFTSGNGMRVLMRDTLPPANPLSLRAEPIGTDTIEATISNISELSPEKIDSVGIWFGSDSLSVALTGSKIRWYNAATLFGDNDEATVQINDNFFTGVSRKIFLAVILKGSNGKYSTPVFTPMKTLYSSTDNPIVLSAKAITPTKVRLTWNTFSSSGLDNIIIWYGTTLIDTGSTPSEDQFDSISVSPDNTSKVLINLTPETDYYFAAQIVSDAVISPVTENSRAACSTPEKSSLTDIENSITIDTLYFDTISGTIKLSWCIDEQLASEDLEVAITYNLTQFPVDVEDDQAITILSRCTDTIVPLSEPLRFDTLYYVALWLRQPEGVWVDPTESSRDTVRIGQPYKQVVSLFDPSESTDTVMVFNGAVVLWKDDTYTEKTASDFTLTIDNSYSPPSGMTPVALPFRFIDAEPTLPFYIGFHLDSIPEGASINDVRIYTIYDGKTSVVYTTGIDADNSIVYVKSDTLNVTFTAMIDTEAPETALRNADDITSPVTSTETLRDTIAIRDNISNVSYQFYFGKGNELPPVRFADTLTDTSDTPVLIISDTMQVISSEYGLRAWVIVTDGLHTDTINLSRSVLRGESDPMTTVGGSWTPVYPTGQLLHKEIDPLIAQLSNGDTVGYDDRYMRLFRWIEYSANKKSSDKWVEYTSSGTTIKKLFTLEPGTMVWVKSRKNKPLHLDSAYTLSPGDTFAIDLPPQQWTDFGMPFRFAVPLSVIFDATGSSAEYIDVCQWEQDDKSETYSLEPYFIRGKANQPDDAVLEYSAGGGYSLYNHDDDTVTLRIPGILPEMASAKRKVFAKRHMAHSAWGVIFLAATEGTLHTKEVYCGYAQGISKRIYPAGPSFSPLRILFAERDENRFSSFCIGEENKEGFAREILLRNNSDSSQTITWNLAPQGTLPEGYFAVLYDPSTGKVSSDGIITVEKQSATSRFIITGDVAFHDNIRATMFSLQYRLHAPYPNPARSMVSIRYTVPAGSQERVRVSIFSVAGRLVWSARTDRLLKTGTNTIVWNGRDRSGNRTASGVYILRLEVLRQDGSRMKHFERRLTYFR